MSLPPTDRSRCWCANRRQPCEYHEGAIDAAAERDAELDRLRAIIAALVEEEPEPTKVNITWGPPPPPEVRFIPVVDPRRRS